MKIKFTKDIEIELVTGLDHSTGDPICENQVFKVGDVEEVDVLEQRPTNWDVQFGDSSVAFGLPTDCFIALA